jgi:hypothetical protein
VGNSTVFLVKRGELSSFSSKKYLFREVLSEKAEHFVLFELTIAKKYEKVAISSSTLVKDANMWTFFLQS